MKNLTKLKNDSQFKLELEKFSKANFIKETKKLLKLINKKGSLDSKDFESVWKNLKALFREIQQNRCCICEKELNDIYSQDIEHYRPKTIYWWLAYNPNNYYLTCAECNRSYKKEDFPLAFNQVPILYKTRKEISKECPLLLNPIIDNPNNYFQLAFIINPDTGNGIAILQAKDDISDDTKARANKTIEMYNLDLHANSKDSDRSRRTLLEKHYNDLIEIAENRKNLDKESFKRYFLKRIKEKPELKTLDLLELIRKNQFKIVSLVP